jgi:hypothetical protein
MLTHIKQTCRDNHHLASSGPLPQDLKHRQNAQTDS